MFISQFQAASFRRKHQYFLEHVDNAFPSPSLCFCSTYSHNWHLGALHCWQFLSHCFGVCSTAVVLLRSQSFAYMISWDSLNSLSQKTVPIWLWTALLWEELTAAWSGQRAWTWVPSQAQLASLPTPSSYPRFSASLRTSYHPFKEQNNIWTSPARKKMKWCPGNLCKAPLKTIHICCFSKWCGNDFK